MDILPPSRPRPSRHRAAFCVALLGTVLAGLSAFPVPAFAYALSFDDDGRFVETSLPDPAGRDAPTACPHDGILCASV